ncbi:MAG TPA: efflux RND transporter periplasmic adaptor subunit [Ignavibacteriaceae bacterium]|nr:efflux RND transporter periplasmic adaptor subunit [Ignavibacteriaceae bacterium]
MKKKNVIILLILFAIVTAAGIIYFTSKDSSDIAAEQTVQQYTCGMHPQIVEDHPGNCPICGMKLVPIKNNDKKSGEKKILYWRAPMDPNEIYDEPGKSKMGMDLVPVYDDEAGGSGIVHIDPAVQQNMNVKIMEVKSEKLSPGITTNGVLSLNEKREFIVTTKVNGWVENLFVNYTGQKVSKGQKLMEIYSPELVSAQQEYLTALSYNKSVESSSNKDISESGNMLIENAKRKLQLLDMSEGDIKDLETSKNVKTNITLYAPFTGTVLDKNILAGQKIMAGMQLLHIADLSTLWLTADVYEYELSKIKNGAESKIKFNYLPGEIFTGKISFIYPTIDPKSRTAKIRIDVPNSNGELKPEMFANVEIAGKETIATPVVPENAVIRSGSKDFVIISLGEGKFKPQRVTLGNYSNGYYQILKGLNEGNKIVTSAQFLIDSESNLRSALGQMKEADTDTTSEMNNTKNESEKEQMKEMKKETKPVETKEENIVRENPVDVNSIDKNKDGKVYQDMMDYNVISDKPGECPLCGMKLAEVTIAQAKDYLIKAGFRVKK